MRKNQLLVAAGVLAGGVLIGAVLFKLPLPPSARFSAASNQPQWTSETGIGTSVPACTSASNLAPTCNADGTPRIEFNWIYNGAHGACTSASIRFLYPAGPANSRMAYGVINDKLYIAQGSQLGVGGRYYYPAAFSWLPIADAPATNGAAPASGVANGKLYSFGSATYEYNPSTNTWATRAAPPVDLSYGQAAAAGNVIYVIKGTYNYEYNAFQNYWQPKASPPNNHGDWPAVAQVGGIIYVIGGGTTNAVDAYAPSNNTWAPAGSKASIPAPLGYKGYASAAAYNNKIYVFGGGGWDSSTAETWEYDPSLNTWARKEDMPIQRNVPAVGTIGSRIFVYGGEYPGVYVSAIHRYNPALGTYGSITGLACPPETNSYVWNGGTSNITYYYDIEILNGSSVIDISNSGSFVVPSCSTCSGGTNIGLRAHDGTGIIDIAVKADTSSPLRIFKNAVTYSILLTSNFADPKASKFRVQTPSGIKAICKL